MTGFLTMIPVSRARFRQIETELETIRAAHQTLLQLNATQSEELRQQIEKQVALVNRISYLSNDHQRLLKLNAEQYEALQQEKETNKQLLHSFGVERQNWKDERQGLQESCGTVDQQRILQWEELQAEKARNAELLSQFEQYKAILQDPVQMLNQSVPYKDLQGQNAAITKKNVTLLNVVATSDAIINDLHNDLATKNDQVVVTQDALRRAELDIDIIRSKLLHLEPGVDVESDGLISRVEAFETLVSSWIKENTPTQLWILVGNPAIEIIKVIQRHGLVTSASPPCLLTPDQFQQTVSESRSRLAICRYIITALLFHKIFRPVVFGLEGRYSAEVDCIEQRILSG